MSDRAAAFCSNLSCCHEQGVLLLTILGEHVFVWIWKWEVCAEANELSWTLVSDSMFVLHNAHFATMYITVLTSSVMYTEVLLLWTANISVQSLYTNLWCTVNQCSSRKLSTSFECGFQVAHPCRCECRFEWYIVKYFLQKLILRTLHCWKLLLLNYIKKRQPPCKSVWNALSNTIHHGLYGCVSGLHSNDPGLPLGTDFFADSAAFYRITSISCKIK